MPTWDQYSRHAYDDWVRIRSAYGGSGLGGLGGRATPRDPIGDLLSHHPDWGPAEALILYIDEAQRKFERRKCSTLLKHQLQQALERVVDKVARLHGKRPTLDALARIAAAALGAEEHHPTVEAMVVTLTRCRL